MIIRILVTAILFAMSTVAASAEVKVSTKGGLKVESEDYSFKVGGRIHYDYNRSELNGITDEDDFDLRRGWLTVSGAIGDDWEFKTQFEVDGGGAQDLFIRYKGWGKAANLTVGKYKIPFGMEFLSSSNDITVLERSGITEGYALGRQEGVSLHGSFGSNQTYAVALFTDNEKDSEKGVAARTTWAPFKTDTASVHLGIAFKDIAEDNAVGFEVGGTSGPFHVQAEYFDGESNNTDLSGYYLQAGYIFTGETRPYKGGVYKRPKPSGKGGAWEGVVRYEDGDGNHGDIELGRTDAKAVTLGVNWYATNNVRLGVSYQDGEDNLTTDDGSEFRVRLQLTY